MPIRLLDRLATPSAPVARAPGRPVHVPDPGREARSRLIQIQAALAAIPAPSRARWREPSLFFFDRRRQRELGLTRTAPPPDPLTDVAGRIAAELPSLCASVEVRRVARAIVGLRESAAALAPLCPEARNLADLLAMPDDEMILVLHPGLRAGFRLTVRGVLDVGQFHVLLAAAVTGDSASGRLPGPPIPDRFVAACRNAGPSTPAGVPMVAEARFQFYSTAAIEPDGSLPVGLGGCEHWLWPATSLAAIPRMGAERVILLGPPAYAAKWEVGSRFPGMPADVRLVEVLGPFRVAEQLTQLTGKPVSPTLRNEPQRTLAKAA